MYNKIPELSDLSVEDAEKVYKKAVELLKKEEPSVYLKSLMMASVGGGIGVLAGSILKDLVFKIPGLNFKAFIVLAVCAIAGGVIGGMIVAMRMEKKIKSRIPLAKNELNL